MTSPVHDGLTLPEFHTTIQPYLEKLEAVKKAAWLLKCEEASDVSRLESHMGGGTPFAPDTWPGCQKCHHALQFVWQLDFSDFAPLGWAQQGLFQFFYCWRCCPEPEDEWGMQVRWFPGYTKADAAGLEHVACPYPEGESIWPKQWRLTASPLLSLPSIFSPANPIPEFEMDRYIDAEHGRVWNVFNASKGLHIWEEMWGRVGGFPPWVSFHDETPFCPVCKNLTEFVAALGSEECGINWGGPGYWYFFACRRTPDCHGLAKPQMSYQCL